MLASERAVAFHVSLTLNESRVLVSSSITEGLPKALLEGMACGLPVVVTDVGDCGLVAEGAGLVVPPRDPRALADGILTLLNDRSLWQSCSLRGQQKAKAYTWKSRADTIMGEYVRLIGVR